MPDTASLEIPPSGINPDLQMLLNPGARTRGPQAPYAWHSERSEEST